MIMQLQRNQRGSWAGWQGQAGGGRLLRLSLVIPRLLPSAMIYIIKPLTELARQNRLIFSVFFESEVRPAHLRLSDIVLFCRNMDSRWDWILEECLAHNIPTVYALDDNFWEVPLEWKYASHYRTPGRLRQLERYLQSVDLVQVYSQPLVERVSQLNPHICLMKPCIDVTLAPKVALPRRDDKVRITYATGRGSSDALIQLFADDLLRFLDQYLGKVEMTWWGEAPEPFLRHPSTRVVPGIDDYDQFVSYLAHEGFDIGLAPLTPTHFNLSKTNTKFRDYGVSRIAGVYSHVEVYSSCVEHEKTGLLVGDAPGAWFDAMQRLVEDARLRSDIQEAAYRYVDQNYRQEVAEAQWLEIIEALMDRKWRKGLGENGKRGRAMKVSLGAEQPPAGYISLVKPLARGGPLHPAGMLIADPDQPLPLVADCLAELFVEGWLEEAEYPDRLMVEIQRVCKHAAEVGILAHYSQAHVDKGSKAKVHFNEETPWFWTPAQPPVYRFAPFGAEAGFVQSAEKLAGSAVAGLDLRCLRMELFYYPRYGGLLEEEKRQLRRSEAQVCEYVLYQCLVVKQPVPESEIGALSERMRAAPGAWNEAPALVLRRLQDLNEVLKDELASDHAALQKAGESEQKLKAEVELKTAELNKHLPMAQLALQELDAMRNRRLVRLIERFVERTDYSTRLPATFQQARDDSLFFSKSLKGCRLCPSQSLARVACLSYPLRLDRPDLCSVGLAFLFELFPRQGEILVEIVAASGESLVQASVRAAELRADAPVVFNFLPLERSAGEALELRIRGKDLDVPVRIYEWVKYPFFGLGRAQARPFCSFDFYIKRSDKPVSA